MTVLDRVPEVILRPLNVLLFARSLTVGGAERQFVQLAKGLRERGHAVTLATFYDGNFFNEAVAESGVSLLCMSKRGRWDFRRFFQSVRMEVVRIKPEVIYTILSPVNVALAAMRPFLPRHGLVWGMRGSSVNWKLYDPVSYLTHTAERRLSNVPNIIVVNSEAGRQHAIGEGFPGKRLKRVSNGIDTSYFRPVDEGARLAARAALGIPIDRPVIGLVARLDPMKDFPSFMHALSRVVSHRKVTALFAGPVAGDKRRSLEGLAAKLGVADCLRWLGEVSDVRQIYAALDLLCLPSAFGEGFPNVIGEAMASGLPCIATDVGDCRSILGRLGTVVPPSNPEALAGAILVACDQIARQQSLGRLIRQRIVKHYSLARMIDRTEELLRAATAQAFR